MDIYQCPRCNARVILAIKPIGPVTCDGNRTHTRATCVVTSTPTPTNQPKKAANVMSKSKNPEFLCQCYSEPAGKPHHYVSCGRLTRSRFAAGHDAKLKGRLIEAYLAGSDYYVVENGGTVATKPLDVAHRLGWGTFLTRAAAVVAEKAEKRTAKAERTALARAAKPKPKAKPADALKPVVGFVKVGRWEYTGAVITEEHADGRLTVEYSKSDGSRHTSSVPASAFRLGFDEPVRIEL